MLTRSTIAAALPPDVLRLAEWYVELRIQMYAALAVLPVVGQPVYAHDGVVPNDLTRAIRCDEACSWLARRMELWSPPIDWPRSWWLVYAGVEASGAVQDYEFSVDKGRMVPVVAKKGGRK